MKKLTRLLTVMLALTLLFTLSAPLTVDAATIKKPVKVTSVKASSVTTTKATISYKKATRAKGYQIQYSTKSSMKSAKTVKTTKLKKTLTGLKSNTTYYVRVRAYNTSSKKKTQYGAWSKVIKTKTTIAKPAQVKSVKASSIKTTSAAVTYAKSTGAKGYQIQYSTKSSMASAKTVKTSKTSATLKSLKSNTKYYVRVRAYNTSSSKKTQYGAWSAKQSFTTKKTTSTASTKYSIKYVDNLDQYKISCYLRYSGTENPTSYTSADSITLKNPTCLSYLNDYRTLYLFDGWYSDKACTKKVTKIAKGTTGNLTFYAKWKPVTFNVKYVLNDSADAPADNTGNPSTYYYGEDRALKAPSREGYVFVGWYHEKYSSHEIENFNDSFAYEDLTLCAKWKAVGKGTISYNVNYKAAWELTMKTLDTSASSDYPRYEAANTGSGSYPIKYYYLLNEGSGTGYSGEALLQPSLPNADFVGWEVTSCSTSDFTSGQIINSITKGFSGNLSLVAVYSDTGLEAKRREILNDNTMNDLEKVKIWANELVHGYYTYGSYRDLSLEDYTALSDKYISLYGYFNTGTCYSGAIKIKEFCDDLGVRCVLRFAGNDTVPGKTYTGTDHRNTYVWYGGKRYCIGATPGGGSEQFEVTKDMIQYLPDYYDYAD